MLTQELLMTGSGSVPITPQAVPAETEELETRFGRVTVYRRQPIIFPNGLLGMPDKFEYCLTRLPSDKLARFKLLQSLEDDHLSLITLPVDVDNNILDKADIQEACRNLEIPEQDATILLVVTVHRAGSNVRLSVNARAPIFINTPKRVATQFVFHHSKYQIQHIITMDKAEG